MISDKYATVVAQGGQDRWLKRKSNVKSFVSILKKACGGGNSLKVLDAGCANGRDTNELASEGFDVIGLDYNKDFIKDAKKRYP